MVCTIQLLDYTINMNWLQKVPDRNMLKESGCNMNLLGITFQWQV